MLYKIISSDRVLDSSLLIERQLGFVVAPAFTPDTGKYNLESNMESCDLASDSSQPASLAFSKGDKREKLTGRTAFFSISIIDGDAGNPACDMHALLATDWLLTLSPLARLELRAHAHS